ncbi:Methyltransferase domain-containing protein [Salegentibacter holothuriorum]|uniref:Methyltransferase domain-containing protein n=1 Tax=Salegentibacter holothuriorum TaxID=241145 RepID=A0A1T5CKR5_9FLAO|nr:class I SAM-dependent methyltransferase [Salegentibacter holothuriorum]SKB60004.1 Methyltransferase domain-containing protein [Salegentibacter holothuriorum]
MKKKGCVLTPEQFQERLNIVFHDHESVIYDEIHSDLQESLQEQIDLLISDLFKYKNFVPKKINILDIGCGTGLSTEYLINSKLEPFVEHITMLDSSKQMLNKAKARAAKWNKPTRLVNGYVKDLQEKFDLIIVCSVLHHIPDLKDFLSQIDQIMKPNGVLIHLQDPNADYLDDKIYKERLSFFKNRLSSSSQKSKSLKDFIPKPARRSLNRLRGRKDYIDLINDQLLEEKVITKRMNADEIWSVTDIHVQNEANLSSKGISLNFLKKHLKTFNLINQRSYGFFGKLKSDLDDELKQKEEKLIRKNQLNGRNLSCIWMKEI